MSCSIFPFTFRYKKTVPQLLIRWSVQKHYITIPKSTQKDRIIENVDVFDFVITEEDMKVLVSVSCHGLTGRCFFFFFFYSKKQHPSWIFLCYSKVLELRFWNKSLVASENSWHFATAPREMTSEKREQKFHTVDASCLRSGLCFWLVEANFVVTRPIRSTSHLCVVQRHQYGISALASQPSFSCGGVAKC